MNPSPLSFSRWIRHWWLDADNARRIITPAGLARLETRVRESETRHRGELRLCVQASLSPMQLWRGVSSQERAIDLFSRLRVWDTEHNNGVLIYLQLADHRIEILADRGLNRHTTPEAWQAMASRLGGALREGRFEDGLNEAIDQVGALMRQHYPVTDSHHPDVNELPDAVVLM